MREKEKYFVNSIGNHVSSTAIRELINKENAESIEKNAE
jgi:hypothetical protein